MLLGRIVQSVLSLFFLPLSPPSPFQSPQAIQAPANKSIAIVGAGTGGLGALKALFDLPEEVRRGWKIDVFDERTDVGGVWLPQHCPPAPPHLPVTPLYPALRTNTPHPTMTYPQFPFRPLTALYPGHEGVQTYHADVARHFNLTQHIHFSHTVINAVYDPREHWKLTVLVNGSTHTPLERHYDHLIVANGHNRYPHEPVWAGRDEWLEAGKGEREIIHSLWFREPERYENHTVIVVGNGASGRDIAGQLVGSAYKIYHSYDNTSNTRFPQDPVPGTIHKPRISHLTNSSIVFTDNTTLATHCQGPTSIILGTGYDLRIPFLSSLSVSPVINSSTTSLTTNLNYIRPLYQHILSLDPSMPTNALAFIGLPVNIANAPSGYAQGLLVAHAIAETSCLPSREDLFKELEKQEDDVEKQGVDPFTNGHRLLSEVIAATYQNDLIDFLRQNSKVPLPAYLSTGKPYVEPWRRQGRDNTFILRRGWLRAEKMGIQDRFIKGAKTEEDWANVMHSVRHWEEMQERTEGREGLVDLPL